MKELFEYEKDKREKIIKELNNNKKFRIKYFEQNFFSFAMFYFNNFFTEKSAYFHKEWAKQFSSGKNCLLIAFRESGKTIWLIVYIIWIIAYKKRRFLLYYSYEQGLSASRLFDIIVQLKTNKRLKKDYGNLFPSGDKKIKEEMGLEKKTVTEFITTNGIKVMSLSISTTSRGLNFTNKEGSFRPDFIVLDDVDVSSSVRNTDVIDKNYTFLEGEIIGGLAGDYQMIFLGNVISNDGLVPRWERKVEGTSWYVNRLPVIKNGKIVWDRYVETNKEKEEYKNKGIKKISLEDKKEIQGDDYNPNMLLIPNLKKGNPVFNQELVFDYKEVKGEKDERYKDLIWYINPETIRNQGIRHVYGIDTAKGGAKGDFSGIVVRDWNYRLICTYKERTPPDVLVDVIDYIFGKLGGNCIIAIENNNTGISTIDKAKVTRLESFMYREKEIDTVTGKTKNKYGFNTNGKSKSLIITEYEENIRKNNFEEMDERIKEEALSYYYDDEGKANSLSGKHDDILMSDMICQFILNKDKQNVL